jgi:hypothetical protein
MVLAFLDSFRDVIIIMWALVSVIAVVLIILATITLWFGLRDLIRVLRATVNEDVRPILTISQDTANNVAGTTRFMSDTVAQPVIRGLSFVAGARKAITVFTGLREREE